MFVHGVGTGLSMYLLWINKMIQKFPRRTIFLPLLSHLSMKIEQNCMST